MDAADVLYGVSMGGDGVTKVVSRRLPREIAEDAEDEGETKAGRHALGRSLSTTVSHLSAQSSSQYPRVGGRELCHSATWTG